MTMSEDNKNPKEASNIFHSIMKASVKPVKKPSDAEIIGAVKERFNVKIERAGNEFILVTDEQTANHDLVREINNYIIHITKNGGS